MARNTVRPGDVIAIRASTDVVGLGKVIYVSTSFKKLMGLRLMNKRFASIPTEAELPASAEYFPGVLYTGTQSVGKEWPIVGHLEVSADEVNLTRRLVGANIYVGDDNLGTASRAEFRALPLMGVKNRYGIEYVVEEEVGKLES